MNPLCDFSDLPRFAEIRAEHVGPAIDDLLTRARDTLEKATSPSTPDTWEGFVSPLEDANERLGLYFGTTGGEVWASANEGESWRGIARHLPHLFSVTPAT